MVHAQRIERLRIVELDDCERSVAFDKNLRVVAHGARSRFVQAPSATGTASANATASSAAGVPKKVFAFDHRPVPRLPETAPHRYVFRLHGDGDTPHGLVASVDEIAGRVRRIGREFTER